MICFNKTLLCITVGGVTYIIVSKLFPEKKTNSGRLDPKQVSGGSEEIKASLLQKLLKDRALKVSTISMFAVYTVVGFKDEIINAIVSALSDQPVLTAMDKSKSISAKLVTTIIAENNLSDVTTEVAERVLAKSLTFKKMSVFLKIKLSRILKKGVKGNKRSLILLLVGIITILAMNGLGGLCLVLEALRKLFEEGEISEALYESLKEVAEESYLNS